MKSVGEAMAIGRTFHESMQKALTSLETGLTGFDEIDIPGLDGDRKAAIVSAISKQTPDRLLLIAQAIREGLSLDEIQAVTSFDPWFLERIQEIIDTEAAITQNGLPEDAKGIRRLKMMGFTDARLAHLSGRSEKDLRHLRHAMDVRASFKRIDTCAAEFEAQTPYMYSTYEAEADGYVECEARPTDAKKVVILGGGPNRIGQGIEFDYCCCHACFALSDQGFETIMINCNPETVSTDYDTSDRLYFEPLTLEHVLEILHIEQERGTLHGVIVQFGGQTPLKLANALEAEGIPILGTSPDAIDLAEDRERFQQLLHKLDLKQPYNGIAHSDAKAISIAKDVGYPLVIRPSFVLGGRAMEIVRDDEQLNRYISTAVTVSGDHPVLLDSYLTGAVEVDVDALSDGKNVHIAGIMEHIEEAGVHSGDSACSLPPYTADPKTPWFSVKEAVLPFARFPGVDTILGPEMRSTGEVMGWDRSFSRAFLKSQMGAGTHLPTEGTVFISIKDADKNEIMEEAARTMAELGFTLLATRGTAKWLNSLGLEAEVINKVYEGRPDITDRLKDGGVQLLFNTTEGTQSVNDSREIRSVALYDRIPYYTTAAGARAAARATKDRLDSALDVRPLQNEA